LTFEHPLDDIISALKCASIISDESLYLMPCQLTTAQKDGNPPGRILLRVTVGLAFSHRFRVYHPGETSNPPSGLSCQKIRKKQERPAR